MTGTKAGIRAIAAATVAAALACGGPHTAGGPVNGGTTTPDGGATAGGGAASGGNGGGPEKFGGPGPWGDGNHQYGPDQGILEEPVVGMSTDEAQNLWVATHVALYLLKPGEKTFKRFDVKDGLHLKGNPVTYCDSSFGGGDKSCPIQGAAADPGISEITGGGAGEVFVGYYGLDEGAGDWSDTNRHTGKLDRVRLTTTGALEVVRLDMVSSTTAEFWHNRTVERLLYDHFQHPHELYVGTNHGVDRMWPDKYRAPAKGEWFLDATHDWMSDHLHPQVCYHRACDSTETGLMLGDWKGLALSKDGNLWVGGRWTGGQINWTADLTSWLSRPGDKIYGIAFGDGYVKGVCNAEGFCNQPVYLVNQEGDTVSIQATTVAPDGRVWFASGRTTTADQPRGIAVWDPAAKTFRYFDPIFDAGMVETDVRDLVALPDGRLAIAGATSGITLWDPVTKTHKNLSGQAFLPDDHVFRLELDTMVNPPVLHVATFGGAASIRTLP